MFSVAIYNPKGRMNQDFERSEIMVFLEWLK